MENAGVVFAQGLSLCADCRGQCGGASALCGDSPVVLTSSVSLCDSSQTVAAFPATGERLGPVDFAW